MRLLKKPPSPGGLYKNHTKVNDGSRPKPISRRDGKITPPTLVHPCGLELVGQTRSNFVVAIVGEVYLVANVSHQVFVEVVV